MALSADDLKLEKERLEGFVEGLNVQISSANRAWAVLVILAGSTLFTGALTASHGWGISLPLGLGFADLNAYRLSMALLLAFLYSAYANSTHQGWRVQRWAFKSIGSERLSEEQRRELRVLIDTRPRPASTRVAGGIMHLIGDKPGPVRSFTRVLTCCILKLVAVALHDGFPVVATIVLCVQLSPARLAEESQHLIPEGLSTSLAILAVVLISLQAVSMLIGHTKYACSAIKQTLWNRGPK